ncbi:MAG TPA: ADP compounds hydrolase NudE [Gammaproteobacteria bacterium]|nr:ADP compounds hydrolase NudE [Gammaproteobacteria bacterium]
MRKKPVIRQRREVARSRLFRIEALDLTFSNGVETTFERLVPGGFGAVIVAAMPDPETVLLIREYCAGTDRYELALPKGRMETGEDPLEAANRELSEETGFAGRTLSFIKPIALAPGYMSHATNLVLVEDLYPCEAEGDEPEPIEVVSWKMDDIYQLSMRDDCSEARTIAGLYLVRDFLAAREKTNAAQ